MNINCEPGRVADMIRRLSILLILLLVAGCRESPGGAPGSETDTSPANGDAAPTAVVEASPEAASTPTAEPAETMPPPTPLPSVLEVSVEPAIDVEWHPTEAPIHFHFNQPVDLETAEMPVSFSPGKQGSLAWNDEHTVLTFTPEPPFRPGEMYVVSLDPGLLGVTGAELATSPEWQMFTQEAPTVMLREPDTPQLNSPQLVVRVTFSLPMDEESVNEALVMSPPLEVALTWEENTLLIEPVEPLDLGEQYRFVIGTDARDVNGEPLRTPHAWSYSLPPLVREARLSKISEPGGKLQVRFNYPIEWTQSAEDVTLEPETAGAWQWDAATRVATFEPEERLQTDTDYLVHFPATFFLEDGTPLPGPEAAAVHTPPPILQVRPSSDRPANPGNPIEIVFDRPMDPESAAAAFHIEPETPGEISWEETTLLFRPESGYLDEFTDYQVTIAESALAADGTQLLDEPYSWSFTTREITVQVSFGRGPNAQVVDSDGRRAVHFGSEEPTRSTVHFELYRLSREQFLDRYASGFRGVQGVEPGVPAITTDDLELVAEWQTETTPSNSWTSPQETIIPEDVPPGLYVLNMVTGRPTDQLILALTGNTIVVKQAEGQLVSWVTNINGDPLPSTAVQVYARDGTLLESGFTDANGVYEAQVPHDPAAGGTDVEPLVVMAVQGDDISVSGLTPEWSEAGYYWWWQPAPLARDYAAYLFTERPIYKPGQTLFYKAAVRVDDDAALSMPPAGTPVTVRIRDARNNVVRTFEHATSAAGSLDGSFAIAEGAMLGTYQLELLVGDESFRQAFKVEDYRKPDLEVVVTTDRAQAVDGEQIVVTVQAEYLFGEPAAGASITLDRLQTESYYDYFAGSEESVWFLSGLPTLSRRADEQGRAVFTVTVEHEPPQYTYYSSWSNSNVPTSWAFEATADDGSGLTVSGYAVVDVYTAGEIADLDLGGYLKQPEQPFLVTGTATDIGGEPVADRELVLELRRWNRGSFEYDQVVQSVAMITGADGSVTEEAIVSEPGYYQVWLTGTDEAGHAYVDVSWLYVFSHASGSWFGGNNQGTLSVSADRESYAPGETATLLIESPLAGPGLLTFERGRTLREIPIMLESPVTRVEIDILPEDIPNVYVKVNVWEAQDTTVHRDQWNSIPDSNLRTASVNLSVPAVEQQLTVTITPDQEVYAPRDEATFVVRVTDHADRPVAGAEVSLALVDEAIFLLSDPLTVPIYEAYYYERDNIVRTYNSLRPVRELAGGGIGGGGDGGPAAGKPRTDFPDTAAWFPALTSNANGEVSITVTLPDSLTTWRLTAFAVTPDTKVGETTAEVVTQQQIILRPILPRTLVAGDELQLSALVHNYSQVTQTVTVTLEMSGAAPAILAAPEPVTLIPGEVQVVGWQLNTPTAGETVLLLTAEGETARDALELPLTVQPLAIPQATTEVGQFTDSYDTTVTLPADALESSFVEVRLSRSIAGSLLTGLEYLTGFPYGCVEQTMSKALPNAVVGRALFQLGVSDPTLAADLPARINAGVQRLYGYQHNDGGWGWWYDDVSDDYQTAWVVFGLATTAEAGYEVDPAVIQRGVDWLNSRMSSMDRGTQAFALFAMATAGLPNSEATLALAERGEGLDPFSRAALALALAEAGEEDEAAAVLDRLLEGVVEEESEAYWETGISDGLYRRKTMASSTRTTALALSALSRLRPGTDLEFKVARYLMNERRQSGWGTTNETAFAIIGLTDHLLATQTATGDSSTYAVRVNGELWTAGQLGRGEPSVELMVPATDLRAGDNALRLEHDGATPLYYMVSSRMLLAREAIEPEGVISVQRRYLDAESGREVERFLPGQLIEVEVAIRLPDDASYMLVEDRLPGGLEALNERLNTTSHAASAFEEPVYYWESLGYNHKEIFGDRVTFFITEMGAGRHTFRYLARATHAGTFTALPAEAGAMYDLTLWGRSAANTILIQPE